MEIEIVPRGHGEEKLVSTAFGSFDLALNRISAKTSPDLMFLETSLPSLKSYPLFAIS